jgi:prepilin-type N-terminal cleavage/methylation domain-containing protein
VLVFEMKQKVRLSIDRSLSGSQRDGEEFQLSAFNLQPSRRAFTIIEMVGVLAIIAIIAAALAPNIIKRIDRAAWQRETSDLNTMANALVQTVLSDKVIPGIAGMSNAIARYSDLAVNQVARTPRGFSRVFMVDPNSNITIPYSQLSNGLVNPPVNARMMILSTIARTLPIIASSSFDNIWSTPDGRIPSTLSSWGGKGEDLCVQRVELGRLFHKVLLVALDRQFLGYYSLETWPSNYVSVVPGPQTTTMYVLDGTALNLYWGSPNPSLEVRVLITQDESFVYQNNRWARSLSNDENTTVLPRYGFGWWVREFFDTPDPPSPDFDATKQAVVDLFYSYMVSYWSWASEGFPGGTLSSAQNPFFKTVKDNQAQLDAFSGNLIR